MKTLQQYLSEASERGTVSHVLTSFVDGQGNVSFYIHPQNVSGSTLDFVVVDNNLLPAQFQDENGITVKTAEQVIEASKELKQKIDEQLNEKH
jgi:hypothetical protein